MRSNAWPPMPEAEADIAPKHPETFPIMHTRIDALDWPMIEPYRAHIQRTHGVTLERLADRGGLDIVELCAVFRGMTPMQATFLRVDDCLCFVMRRVEAWVHAQP